MNDNENPDDSKRSQVCGTIDISSMFYSALESFAEKRGITVEQLASQLEATEQKRLLVQGQEEEKKKEEEKKREDEKTDFATFQEVADYLDSILSYQDKGVFLEYGDQDELYHFHFGFGLFIRNNFIYGNKSTLELARDCSRITGHVVSDDLSRFEFDPFDGDSFGGKLMELYYQWLAMLPPFSG